MGELEETLSGNDENFFILRGLDEVMAIALQEEKKKYFFKYINDFYGMDEGDKVMQDIADFYFINEPLCLASHGIGFDQFRGAYKVDNMTNEDVVGYIARKNRIFEKELSERYPLGKRNSWGRPSDLGHRFSVVGDIQFLCKSC